jgi:histone deacetylase 6
LTIFDKVAMPVARAFNPDIVLVSCGFDACRGDPLGEFDVTASGYARMTQRLMSLADGKCVSALFWLYFSVVCHTFPFPSF